MSEYEDDQFDLGQRELEAELLGGEWSEWSSRDLGEDEDELEIERGGDL